MKFLQIAGLMKERIDIDVDYVASPSIDLEVMEIEEVSGFTFKLPAQLFPLNYQDDDFEIRITENIGTTDTFFNVDDASLLSAGDEIWIKNEVIAVTAVTTTTVTATRGMYNTFAQKYTIDEELNINYFMRKYSKLFIGQRVFLWEDDVLLSIGLIAQQPNFNGTILEFTCENAISALDINWTIPNNPIVYDRVKIPEANVTTLKLNQYLTYADEEGFQFELPPILDYLEIPLNNNITSGASDKTSIPISELGTILDYLKLYSKLNASVFTWNQSRGLYTFVSISDVSSLDAVSSIELSSYNKISSPYRSSLYTGISQISIKLANYTINVNNENATQYTSSQVLEIDLTKFIGIKGSDVKNIAFFYSRLFSIIYSKLVIPTHEVMFEQFEEGRIYSATDIDKFYTFQNVSSKIFCVSKDESNIIFLIIRDVVKNPISPAIRVKAIDSTTLQQVGLISDYLLTTKINVEDAEIEGYNYKYFDDSDVVNFINDDGTTSTTLTISDVVNDTIVFSGTSFTTGDEGYLMYDIYTNCTTRQRVFFFLDINSW